MSYRVVKHTHPAALTTTPEDTILQHIDDVMNIEHALPKPKVLKSCIRCRKHKTKCDAHKRQPGACSSCEKKGVPCKIDYVLPPQRFDNLKHIISQVDQVQSDYDKLESRYLAMFASLGIEVPSFEEWRDNKLSQLSECPEEDEEEVDSISLIKLSDGSFISMNYMNQEQLLINNKIISIPDLESKLIGLVKKLDFLYSTIAPESSQITTSMALNYESDTQSQHSSSSESSIASPRSIHNSPLHRSTSPSTSTSTLHQNSLQWFDIDFHVSELFRVNKFLLVLLVSFYYPTDTLLPSYTVFLSDYLNSFYQIIESQSKSLTSSTYSNHLLNSIIPGCSVFDKQQLRELVDAEVFNSDVYLKRLTQILFLNVLLFGIDDNLRIMNDFVRFVEVSINLNRKKINFDKSRDLRFIESFVRLWNVFSGDSADPALHIAQSKKKSVSKEFETYFALMKMNASVTTQGVAIDGEITNIHSWKKQFKKFLETWEPYLEMYSSGGNLFVDDFTLELVLMNCLILINEGFSEFNSVLVDFLTRHDITMENENVSQLINAFKQDTSSLDFTLSCEKMKSIALTISAKKRNVVDLKMNDIQVILENVDWKKESTDEVLKKIGVI